MDLRGRNLRLRRARASPSPKRGSSPFRTTEERRLDLDARVFARQRSISSPGDLLSENFGHIELEVNSVAVWPLWIHEHAAPAGVAQKGDMREPPMGQQLLECLGQIGDQIVHLLLFGRSRR